MRRYNPNQTNISLIWLKKCYHLSRGKQIWVLLLVVSSIAVLTSLWFQWQLNWTPCHWCVYQRLAMLAIALTSTWQLSLSKPRRVAGGQLLLLVNIGGFLSAIGQLMTQATLDVAASKRFFVPCTVKNPFPDWFPLDRWLPRFLMGGSDCSPTQSGLIVQFIPWLTASIFMVGIAVALLLLCGNRLSEKAGLGISNKVAPFED